MARPGNPKEKLLTTAARLFFEQGYQATGINQILEEAGVAKASLYTHFGSREALALAYLKEARTAWFRAFTTVVEKEKKPVGRLLAIFSFLEESLPAHDFRGCRFINMQAELAGESPVLHAQIKAHKQQLRRYIRRLATDAGKPSLTGDTAYLLFESAIVESMVHRDLWPVKTAVKQLKALLSA
ncbi:TetR/AcrR family transcriptional regulator [Chitinophaga varians]|uniref:TetR/AcrR family transcriptional regulator n=1 Tax=Chitinophaga varians TaxID=2202339 RepID=UPI00165F5BBC|nr:TetR/AcrR family transcriptional regulator [Chitinophaga varians]MBC9909934.1 TetR/AcrR family transcriptional regulator [Chitinophaga varians]